MLNVQLLEDLDLVCQTRQQLALVVKYLEIEIEKRRDHD
jgi:hypothetical protein